MVSSLEDVVSSVVLEVVRLRAPETKEVRPEQHLKRDLRLDSLDLAQIASALEEKLDAPIFDDVAIKAILSVSELCEVCAAGTARSRKEAR